MKQSALDPHFTRDARHVLDDLGSLVERFSGCTVLVTGLGGFLGAQFAHFFLALNDSGALSRPCRLVALDNFIRAEPWWLAGLRGRSNFELQSADITSPRDLGAPDFIIHAASIASPTFYRQFPIETMDANVIGLRILLEHASVRPVESLLFFSTSEIYGDPDPANIPTEETYRGNVSCTGPRACYDESKRYGETLCVNFARSRNIPVSIARPFNNYGPGLRLSDRRVLPDLFRDALAGNDLVLLSDGRATRTFCYAADAVAGYLRILLRGRAGESYNIGCEVPEISMLELARMVARVAGGTSRVIHQASDDRDYLTDNPQRRCPVIRKAREELDFSPTVGLEEGLERCHAYYRDHASD